ncbi:MAG: hypothetical protein IPM56_16205 [Ignavibacteriales bacterium]|nr:MAG: hypothetical protein IPM56_16205 [Ignavibacteriales bacterium]
MPLIDRSSLKSFYGKNSFITQGDTAIVGHDDAVKQASNIVYQHTLIPIPADIEQAIGILQFYAHSIYQWITTGMQDKLDEFEMSRRRKMFDDAMAALMQIKSGKLDVYDDNGVKVETGFSKTSTYYVDSDNRSERL